MATVVTCPDCGGVIGAANGEGNYPCRCPVPAPPGATATKNGLPPPPPVKRAKICCQCGKDLTGKKRLRDSLGYWCVECHKKDKEKDQVLGLRCPDCGRIIPEEKLLVYDGLQLCIRCVRSRKEIAKAKVKAKVDSQHYEEHEKRRLVILGVIFGLLLLIVLLSVLVSWLR